MNFLKNDFMVIVVLLNVYVQFNFKTSEIDDK